jgi:transcriptional regulator with XRE-family HTH domain
MTLDEPPAVARRRLRLALRRERDARGLTQRHVAEALDWSLSKVNRIEAGDVTISGTDLQALLRLFEITDPDRVGELTEEARAARRRGWWDQPDYREHLTPAMIQSLQFEVKATAISAFQPNVVPGVLQTRGYAESLMDFWVGDLADAVRATRVESRMRRRDQLLHRLDPPDFRLVLDESVLLREVGGPLVMSGQLDDLLGLVRAGRVSVRVVPLAHPTAYVMAGSFTIYVSGEEDVALYRENQLGDELVYEANSLRRSRHRFERVWDQSLGEEASTRLIDARAAAWRSAADR